ncbi:MAG: serine protein kinase PrkA, partial [Myxococcales bacterium]|nr:serine protein kinase PrkA [Myxococcales bacterium]
DRSLGALPGSLHTLNLFEPYGDLVDGNRGLVEFNDLLKRPMDLNRYLLSTSETGTVPMDNVTLYIDTFLIGTVNEAYLDAFKGQPDWASYKGRIELIRMPYLLDYQAETKIYEVQLGQMEIAKPVAPGVARLAAIWAVLTRLTKPDVDAYPKAVREAVKQLSPYEKAQLYAIGKVPDQVGGSVARELRAAVPDLYQETSGSSDYEGRMGASPREIKTILLNAAHDQKYPCFSPLALFSELDELVRDPSVYEFLQLKPNGDYNQPSDFVEVIREVYLDEVDDQLRSAMGLVDQDEYSKLFKRYVDHVNHWIKKEKLLDPVSGTYKSADERFMKEVEDRLGVEGERDEYRHNIISTIGAFRVDNPNADVDFGQIFERQFAILRRRFFEEQADAIRKIKMNLLRYFDGDTGDMQKPQKTQVEKTLAALKTEHGYTDETAREAIGFLVRNRYAD